MKLKEKLEVLKQRANDKRKPFWHGAPKDENSYNGGVNDGISIVLNLIKETFGELKK